MKNKIYAKKGEAVLCTNGHVICHFTEDVMVGGGLELDRQLKFVDGQFHPPLGTDLSECKCWCGAEYISGTREGVFHFTDGWRIAENCKEERNE